MVEGILNEIRLKCQNWKPSETEWYATNPASKIRTGECKISNCADAKWLSNVPSQTVHTSRTLQRTMHRVSEIRKSNHVKILLQRPLQPKPESRRNSEEISEQNAKVIESRNQGSVELTLFECLRCPQTRLSQIPDIRVLSHGTIVGPHTSPFIYQPIRVPDSVSFGCPAPRLGLPLLGSAARLSPSSLCLLYFGVWGETGWGPVPRTSHTFVWVEPLNYAVP